MLLAAGREHPDADVTPVIPVIRDRITALERKSAKDDEAIAALRATNDALSKRVEEAKASLATELRRISDESRDRASELRDTLASTMTSPMAAGARGLKSTPTMEAAPTSALLNLKIGGLTDEVKEIKEWMRSSGADGSGDDTRRELQEAKDDILEVAGRVLDVETRLDQMNTSVDRLGKAVRAGSRRPHSPGPQSATTPVSPAAGNSEAVAAEFARINEELEALREEVAEKATSAELTTAVDAVLTSRGIGRHGAIDSEARSKLERLSRAVEANKDRLARDEAHILAKASQKEVEAAEEEARLATQKVAELEATVGAFGDDGGLGRTLCQWVQLLAQKTQMPLESERAAGSGMSPEEQARLVHNILLEEWGPVIRAKANTVLLEDKADKRDFQRLDRLLAELTKRVALLRSAMSRTMQEHDHAMLSGKPLDPWKCERRRRAQLRCARRPVSGISVADADALYRRPRVCISAALPCVVALLVVRFRPVVRVGRQPRDGGARARPFRTHGAAARDAQQALGLLLPPTGLVRARATRHGAYARRAHPRRDGHGDGAVESERHTFGAHHRDSKRRHGEAAAAGQLGRRR